MGSITRSVESETNLTVMTVVGEADAPMVLAEILSFLLVAPTRQVLWDIRLGILTEMSPNALRMIVHRAGPFARVRDGGQTAIVCSRDVDFGLCRMFQTFAEQSKIPFEIHVSRDIDEARRWLGTGR